MKKNIVLYLFVFTALILIYQLVNSKKVFDDLSTQLTKIQQQNEKLKDSIFQTQSALEEQNDFNLEGNDYALRYFDNLPIDDVAAYVKDQIYETNLLPEKNDLIPYAAMDRTFLINKVKVLNHKWIVADFSDGTHWGELFLTYRFDDQGQLTFYLKEHFLYPNPD
jgi:hypothetical protein